MTVRQAYFATAGRGLEDLLAEELSALNLDSVHAQRGGVTFATNLAGAYRACLWSRLASRILLPLTEFNAEDDDQLYSGTRNVNWTDHLGPEQTLAVSFTGIRPTISHSRFAEQRVKDAIVDQIRDATGERPSVDTREPDLRIHAHMEKHHVTLALDLSGESLHRRGYREAGNIAPLKENLAAAMLVRADWPQLASDGSGLVDPMCGSGTLVIEAAMMASDTAPGLLRTHFGFLSWRGHDATVWKALVDEAIERQQTGQKSLPALMGLDNDPAVIRIAAANARRAGFGNQLRFETGDLTEARPNATRGLLITNPPYGERLGQDHELLPLYLRLGQTLREHFPEWRAVVLNGSGFEIGLKPERSWQLFNGPIECRLERFEIGESPGEATQPAADLVNRISKNRRQLSRWLTREGIHCYRIYDADIPEYALAVDVYGTIDGDDWLHVQEYQPPGTVDARKAQSRLRAALTALPDALGVDPSRMVFKVRKRQRGQDQYQRQGNAARHLIIQEGRCRLKINLTDYLDTGLFLDHRPIRLWLAENAAGKRLLNLFCYTGAATVHAAVGGAAETTSVDLSNTYLDWLADNLTLNECATSNHRLVQADCREWLIDCDESFDLIFLDPPSFSNSKRMEGVLDIQRDHAELIDQAMACLSADGTLIFSTNLRRFRLDPELEQRFEIDDRSPWSIPRDFQRNQRIHQCWFIRRR